MYTLTLLHSHSHTYICTCAFLLSPLLLIAILGRLYIVIHFWSTFLIFISNLRPFLHSGTGDGLFYGPTNAIDLGQVCSYAAAGSISGLLSMATHGCTAILYEAKVVNCKNVIGNVSCPEINVNLEKTTLAPLLSWSTIGRVTLGSFKPNLGHKGEYEGRVWVRYGCGAANMTLQIPLYFELLPLSSHSACAGTIALENSTNLEFLVGQPPFRREHRALRLVNHFPNAVEVTSAAFSGNLGSLFKVFLERE